MISVVFQIKDQATNGFQAFIVHYRDDPDQQNLIDWMQEGWVRVQDHSGLVQKAFHLHFLDMNVQITITCGNLFSQ